MGRVVLAVSRTAQPDEQGRTLKPVAALLDAEPVLTDELLMLVEWLSGMSRCAALDGSRRSFEMSSLQVSRQSLSR